MAALCRREQVENLAEHLKQLWEITCCLCGTTETVQFNAITGYFAAGKLFDTGWRFRLKDNQVVCHACRHGARRESRERT